MFRRLSRRGGSNSERRNHWETAAAIGISAGVAALMMGLLFLAIAVLQNAALEQPEQLTFGAAAEYSWRSTEARDQARILNWVDVAQDPLSGFAPHRGFVTEVRGPAGAGLRDEGGLGMESKSLAVLGRDGGFIISTGTQLERIFSPVETAEEAVSFVAAQIPCVHKLNSGLVVARTAVPVPGEFWVQLATRSCGCVVHEPTGAVFSVSRNGKIQRLASAPLGRR